MRCISTISYFILINSMPTKPFPTKKGLREGDPILSFLFAMAMEYFSLSLKKVKGGSIQYHPKCKN